MKRSDRNLGMNRPITRRDFVNGMAVSALASIMPGYARVGPGNSAAGIDGGGDVYPPPAHGYAR